MLTDIDTNNYISFGVTSIGGEADVCFASLFHSRLRSP